MIGLGGMLTIIFVIFKLLGKLDWSWWWVFAPIWLPIALVLGFMAVVLLLKIIAEVF